MTIFTFLSTLRARVPKVTLFVLLPIFTSVVSQNTTYASSIVKRNEHEILYKLVEDYEGDEYKEGTYCL